MSAPPIVVAIDGPAGVGKSTVARGLASLLGLPVLETGAMYRAVALHVLEKGGDPEDSDAVVASLGSLDLELVREGAGFQVRLGGRLLDRELRSSAVAEATSKVALVPEVRSAMVALQRRMAREAGAVMEGRDIGTVVVPETPYKFFLDARPEVRADRRWREMRAAGEAVSLESILSGVLARDDRDRGRELSPLRSDASYVEIDTSGLTPDEVVEALARSVRQIRERTDVV
jgi:cytidylate kinase